jgi:hypothetical protein
MLSKNKYSLYMTNYNSHECNIRTYIYIYIERERERERRFIGGWYLYKILQQR